MCVRHALQTYPYSGVSGDLNLYVGLARRVALGVAELDHQTAGQLTVIVHSDMLEREIYIFVII